MDEQNKTTNYAENINSAVSSEPHCLFRCSVGCFHGDHIFKLTKCDAAMTPRRTWNLEHAKVNPIVSHRFITISLHSTKNNNIYKTFFHTLDFCCLLQILLQNVLFWSFSFYTQKPQRGTASFICSFLASSETDISENILFMKITLLQN